MKIYFCKYFKKHQQSFCVNSRLFLYILKGSGSRNCFGDFIFLRVTIIGPQNSNQKDILLARFLQELNKQKRPETSYQTSHLVQNICISVYLYNVLGNFSDCNFPDPMSPKISMSVIVIVCRNKFYKYRIFVKIYFSGD